VTAGPVEDDEVLLRRVTWAQVADGTITSGAFWTSHDDGCSTCSESHLSRAQCLEGFPGRGLVSITGAAVRASGAQAQRDPKDPGHVLIVFSGRAAAKALAKRAVLVLAPTPPDEAAT